MGFCDSFATGFVAVSGFLTAFMGVVMIAGSCYGLLDTTIAEFVPNGTIIGMLIVGCVVMFTGCCGFVGATKKMMPVLGLYFFITLVVAIVEIVCAVGVFGYQTELYQLTGQNGNAIVVPTAIVSAGQKIMSDQMLYLSQRCCGVGGSTCSECLPDCPANSNNYCTYNEPMPHFPDVKDTTIGCRTDGTGTQDVCKICHMLMEAGAISLESGPPSGAGVPTACGESGSWSFANARVFEGFTVTAIGGILNTVGYVAASVGGIQLVLLAMVLVVMCTNRGEFESVYEI
jgi:hypothetical protein